MKPKFFIHLTFVINPSLFAELEVTKDKLKDGAKNSGGDSSFKFNQPPLYQLLPTP